MSKDDKNTLNLGQRAYEHVQFLVREIGARPAGGEAEQKTQDYITRQLKNWGYDVQKQPVAFAPLPRFFAGYVVVGLFMGIISWWVSSKPLLTIWMPLYLVVAATYARWSLIRRKCSSTSSNIHTYKAAPDNTPTIILCAHIDTARVNPFRNKVIRLVNYYTFYVLQRIAIIVFLLSVFTILGFSIPKWLYLVVSVLGSLGGGWLAISQAWNQIFHNNQYSPGANDNASGVGVALALAEYYSGNISQSEIRLCYLFTTAEETSLSGALEFAKLIKKERPCIRRGDAGFPDLIILIIDMVGAGKSVAVIEGEGFLFPSKTDKQVNDILKQFSSEVKTVWYNTRSGDYARFAQLGIPSAAIQITGTLKTELRYHTVHDNLEIIDIPSLELTIEFVKKFIDNYSLKIKPN